MKSLLTIADTIVCRDENFVCQTAAQPPMYLSGTWVRIYVI